MSKKMSPKTNSDLLLNIKDIEKFKKENLNIRQESKAYDIEKSLEKYNQKMLDALSAPIPNISLHYNEVLCRAVTPEIKTKGGLIISSTMTDIESAKKLDAMSHAIDHFQEILMVGSMITETEQKAGIRPGRVAKIKWDRFRTMDDDHVPGVINTSIKIPHEMIDGNPYIIIDKRDIVYTKDKD